MTRATVLILCGWAVMNGALLLPTADRWSQLIVAIAILASLGLLSIWPERRAILWPQIGGVVPGIAGGLAIYAAAALLGRFPSVAAQAQHLYDWRVGHSGAVVLVTLTGAVLGEEIFWRAAVARLLDDTHGSTAAIVIGSGAYALAHVGSGLWLLPFAAFGAGLVWTSLYLWTRNLTAPIVAHLIFDVLVLIVAPLG